MSICSVFVKYVCMCMKSHCLKSTHCVDKFQGGQNGQVISGKLCEHNKPTSQQVISDELPAILDDITFQNTHFCELNV